MRISNNCLGNISIFEIKNLYDIVLKNILRNIVNVSISQRDDVWCKSLYRLYESTL